MRDSNLEFLRPIGHFNSQNSSEIGNRILLRMDHCVCNGLWQDKYEGSIV